MPRRRTDHRAEILLAFALSLAAAGCADRNTHAASPANTAPASAQDDRPMNVAPDTDAVPPVETLEPPPTLPSSSSPSQQPAAIQPTKPVAPRRPGAGQPAAETESEPASRPPAPQISPQLSPGDQDAYQHRTNEDISVAEKNLQQASGRQLSSAQRDLSEKIRSFISQARQAGQDGDWTRAQNLAQKAHLLSTELIDSF
jgi:hypothetical protein